MRWLDGRAWASIFGTVDENTHPADRCPYSRAFGYGFEACPGFEATVASVTDSRGGALQPVLTCRYLAIGHRGNGRFYPRCALGGPAVLEEGLREAIGD